MTSWTVEVKEQAYKDFRKLEDGAREAVLDLIEELETEGPAVYGAIEMRANPDTWRVRFYNERYRMVYQVSRTRKRIRIIRMRLRGVVYKGMKDSL